jgi:tRNA(fMet)-specific endonuclease VapC
MDKALLDTDIFSEILKGKNANVIKVARSYHAHFGQYTISTITVMEIVKGFHRIGREDQIKIFLAAISAAEILTLGVKSSVLAGRIYADLERTGQPIGRSDPMIAAIALENELVLGTGNLAHYKRIQDLGYPLKLGNWKT